MSTVNSQLPLIILTGHRKSGTSLFQRLFDGISELNLYPIDISLLYAYFPCFTNDRKKSNDDLKRRLIKVIEQSTHYLQRQNPNAFPDKEQFILILQEHIRQINLRDKTAVITAVHAAWLEYQNHQKDPLPFVFKETSQTVYFDDYKKRFPLLKMIAVIRDPRDNYAAIENGVDQYYSKIGENHLAALSSHINRARMDLLAARLNQQNYADSFMAIRFEDLVERPVDTMHKVCHFLNIKFSDQLLTPQIDGKKYTGNNHQGMKFNGISDQHVGAWKQRIAPSSAKVIEYWMADVMQDWGYELEFDATDAQNEFSNFYEHYNCRYFFNDSFHT